MSVGGLHEKCTECGKVAISVKEMKFADRRLILLKCGHVVQLALAKSSAERLAEWKSLDGRTPYEFQREAILRTEENNGIQGLFDQMGLGKTIEAFGYCWLRPEKTKRTLMFCKSGLKTQAMHEWVRWVGHERLVQVIESTIERCWEPFSLYIVSYDILQHFQKKYCSMCAGYKEREKQTCTHDDTWMDFLFNGIKFDAFIIDECQRVKNPESKRTQLLRRIIKKCGTDNPCKMGLSGTPWENNFSEAFVIMNILDPMSFSHHTRFVSEWCDTYYSASGAPKVGGLRPDMVAAWREKTRHLLTRRMRNEVGLQLPEVNRLWRYIDLEDIHKKAYSEQMLELLDYVDECETGEGMSFGMYSNILAMLSRLRHIAGLSKVKPCVEFVEEFLLEEPGEKLVIFTHHLDVAQVFIGEIGKTLADAGYAPPIHFKAGADFWDLTQEFMRPESRIAIASTLAAGEGLNLQFCSRAVMLERQWNPPKEEQAESRFTRIGSEAAQVDINYFLAIGTVDDHFTQIVEYKRALLKRSHGEPCAELEEQTLVLELIKVLQSKGREIWKLPR